MPEICPGHLATLHTISIGQAYTENICTRPKSRLKVEVVLWAEVDHPKIRMLKS